MAEPRFKAEWVDGKAHFDRLRSLPCCVPGCDFYQSVVHHERRGTGGGTAYKPPGPEAAVNLCPVHHQIGHDIGWQTFERRFGVDLKMVAAGQAMVSRGMGLLPAADARPGERDSE